MYIIICVNCGKKCGYYLGAEDLKVFCSQDCLITFDFPCQSHGSINRAQNHNSVSYPETSTELTESKLSNNGNKNVVSFTSLELNIDKLIDNNEKIILTKTQFKILELVATGKTNTEIASELWVAKRSVESHIGALLSKFGLHNRTELAIAFRISRNTIAISS